jgi:hypothetical protein
VAGNLEGKIAGSELTEILRRFEIEAVSVLAERGSFAPLAVLCLDQTFTPLILDFETGKSREASFSILQDAINLSRPDFAVLLAFEHILSSGDATAPWELHLCASIATADEEVHECFRVEGPPSRLELVKIDVIPEQHLLSRTMWSNPACDIH